MEVGPLGASGPARPLPLRGRRAPEAGPSERAECGRPSQPPCRPRPPPPRPPRVVPQPAAPLTQGQPWSENNGKLNRKFQIQTTGKL